MAEVMSLLMAALMLDVCLQSILDATAFWVIFPEMCTLPALPARMSMTLEAMAPHVLDTLMMLSVINSLTVLVFTSALPPIADLPKQARIYFSGTKYLTHHTISKATSGHCLVLHERLRYISKLLQPK